MTEIICTMITAFAGIIVALLSIQIKKGNERAERIAKTRERESLINLKLTSSAVKLSMINSNAIMEYKNNGNVEEAYQQAKEAEDEYQAFLREVAAHEVSK